MEVRVLSDTTNPVNPGLMSPYPVQIRSSSSGEPRVVRGHMRAEPAPVHRRQLVALSK